MTTHTATMADQLREISRDASRMAERLDRRASDPDDKPLAVDVFFDMTVPGARLYASRAMNGTWWYYLTLPPGVRPKNTRLWMHNESRREPYYWTSSSAETEDEALRKGIAKLLETEVE